MDRIVLISDQLQFLFLHRASLFVFLVRRPNSTQYLFVNVAEVATNLVLLEVLEHILEVLFVDQSYRGSLGASSRRERLHRLFLFLLARFFQAAFVDVCSWWELIGCMRHEWCSWSIRFFLGAKRLFSFVARGPTTRCSGPS